jgi:ribonuclease BN (tRNA processing enzyme)
MQLAFLGTGAAFSLERYNGAVVVDRRILLDGGAPLLPHMHRLGIDPGGIEVIFLSHFHGDHMAGLIPYLGWRAWGRVGSLTIVAPPGGRERIDQLMTGAWGEEWRHWLDRDFDLRHVEAVPSGEACGIPFETVRLDHGSVAGTGYRLRVDGRLLAYAGDTQATQPLEELVRDADVVVTEATAPGQVVGHTSWEEAAELAARHPSTRFIFNHIYAGDPEAGARDLEVVEV